MLLLLRLSLRHGGTGNMAATWLDDGGEWCGYWWGMARYDDDGWLMLVNEMVNKMVNYWGW